MTRVIPLCFVGVMSEIAANVKLFSFRHCEKPARPDTRRTAGAEDKPLLGSKLSADSGARPGWGSRFEPPAIAIRNWDGIKAINPRGLGTESPELKPRS